MKKLLISILIILLLVLCWMTMTKGIKIGNLDVKGLGEIKAKYDNLGDTVLEATTLASKTYGDAYQQIKTDVKKLQEEKKKYDQLVSVSTGSEIQSASQYQKYEIEYLWTIIGNHATSEGVIIKMDLVSGSSENNYNLNFTVTGPYIGIADFISSIENDSALGFKIENFYMIPDTSTENLKATFTCRDITIKDIANSSAATRKVEELVTDNTSTTEGNTAQNSTDSTAGTATSTNTNTVTNQNTTGGTSNTSSSSTKDDDDYSEEDFKRDLEAENY